MKHSTRGGMYHVRRGRGRPLLLIHGLGGTWRSWVPVLDALAREREVIALDLPGHGETPMIADISVPRLADAVTAFLEANDLREVDMVGSSMGARLVLELARRGVGGRVVSLDPGGFWRGWETVFFHRSIQASIKLVRALQPVMPLITHSDIGRTVLFPQFSPRPWDLPADTALAEMRSFAASPAFDPLLESLVKGARQQGAPRGTTKEVVIGWGRQDRICLPRQARRAVWLFQDASFKWFDDCGHFPHWDQPRETVRLVLDWTG